MLTPADPIPDPTASKPPRVRRTIPVSLRIFVAINAVAACVSLLCLWYFGLRPIQIHREAYHRISTSVESLAHRRPAGVSRNQWSFIIGWTMNAIGNCCSVDGFLNPDKNSHERFLTLPDRFDERLR